MKHPVSEKTAFFLIDAQTAQKKSWQLGDEENEGEIYFNKRLNEQL